MNPTGEISSLWHLNERHRAAYDAAVAERDARRPAAWKIEERRLVLETLKQEERFDLLEIGAGTGRDAMIFSEAGFSVHCIDLSPASIARCRRKGLDATVMDFADLAFEDESFDAVYGLNCLLHVPTSGLPRILGEIRRVLRPGGLFYFGTYGGMDREGIYESDTYRPHRYFSFHSDTVLRELVCLVFDIVWFRGVDVPGDDPGFKFQSLLLRRTVE